MIEKFHSTSIGVLHLVVEDNALIKCKWHDNSKPCHNDGSQSSGNAGIEESKDLILLEKTLQEIDLYLEGKLKSFSIPIRLTGTPFQQRVWEVISKIPYGETISYGELAEKVGNPKGSRAVARACGANPIGLIVPCHRVVGSNGKLGGYTGGVDKKISLLNLETLLSNKIIL